MRTGKLLAAVMVVVIGEKELLLFSGDCGVLRGR